MTAPEKVLAELAAKAREVGERLAREIEGAKVDWAAQECIEALGAAGLTAWTVPARDGGAKAKGLCEAETVSVRALCAVRDELAWHHPLLDVMFVMQGLGSFPVALGGKPELRELILPRVARSRNHFVAAFALTETGAGSSLDDVATQAVRTKEGWKLDGEKTFISNAGIASFYSVLARTSGEPGSKGGLSMFFVSAAEPGVSVERFEVLGEHPIGTVKFQGVQIGKEHLLGAEGGGQEIALATLARFRTSVAAAANGFSRRAIDETTRHLKARKQFGRALASFQALRFDVAEMDVRLRAAQLLTAEAARLVDADEPAAAAVARAKLYATESAGWICDRAVQAHGGLGVRRGTVVERLYRDVRALRIYEGTSEVQKLVLAREILG